MNTTYILEKSRVVFQEKDESNYHVFYQLLKSGDEALISRCHLKEFVVNPELAGSINQSGCISIEDVDDRADFNEMNVSFQSIGFSRPDVESLYDIVAAIMHFSNIDFDSHPTNSEESIIRCSSERYLACGTELFGVNPELLQKALLFKMIKSGGGRRSSVAFSTLLPPAAYENKNALVKEIYNRCFDWIVGQINILMGFDPANAERMIGILDIFGFEIFQKACAIVFNKCVDIDVILFY